MFGLIKQVFIVLLSFSSSFPTKCLPLNDEPRMVRPTLIDLIAFELKYYPFLINLDKFSGSLISIKYVFQKTKDINLKIFYMTINKLKQSQNILHVIVNPNSIVQM